MPIFEYQCSDCSEVFERLVLSRRDNHVECPSCGKTHVKQLVSRFAAHVAGGAASDAGQCFNQAAGICEAGGGPMT